MQLCQSLSELILSNKFQGQTLCFTGHRPEKLPKGKHLAALIRTMYYYIDLSLKKGYSFFLIGMADGIDYLAADYLFQKRLENPEICIIGIQPFENYEFFFQYRHYSMERLEQMKQNLDTVICLPEQFILGEHFSNDESFRNRNRFLVDHASMLIAVCSLEQSGSKQTYVYAKHKDLIICRIEPYPGLLYTPSPEQWPTEKIHL